MVWLLAMKTHRPNFFRVLSIAANTSLFALSTLGLGVANAFAHETNPVTACGVTFDLPAHLRITKPRRTVTAQGVAECAVGILPAAKTSTPKAVCRDRDEGGSAPYQVCDWSINGIPDERVVVAQTNLALDKKAVGAFSFTGSAWQLNGASGSDGEAAAIDFFGKNAFQVEANYRTWWHRTKITKYQSEYAGTASKNHVLLQLAPRLAVSLESPPGDQEDDSQCTVFCASLRLATPK